MPDTPFFRGRNRMDWLFAVMLQTACDWKSSDQISDVASLIGPNTVERITLPFGIGPLITLVYTEPYLFVVSSSTRGAIQWIGNVLGSSAVASPPAGGTVSTYFGSISSYAYQSTRNKIAAASATRQIVLIGFSLGGSVVTILKDMLSKGDGIESACIAFGTPRAGTLTFAAAYPAANYSGFGVINDPVPSVPPVMWTGLGLHNYWTPYPPFVTYTQIGEGATLKLGGSIDDGWATQPVDEVILGFDTGLFASYHNQPLYGRLLRTGLPATLPDGFDGYPNAGNLDQTASEIFNFGAVPWLWSSNPTTPKQGSNSMTCQLAFYIRDKASPPLGFQEVYYFAGDDPAVPYQAALSPANNWITKRANFLSSSLEIYALRCSHVGSPKKSYLTKFSIPTGGNLGVSDNIQVSVAYFGYSAGHTVKRQFHFRGLPGTWVTADKLTGPGQTGQQLITGNSQAFLDTLAANGMCALAGRATPALPYTISSAAQSAQNQLITLTLTSAVSIVANTLIEIRGCKQAPLLNGRWLTVGTPGVGQVTLSGSERYSAPASLNGTLGPVVPTAYALTTFQFNAVSKKNTGRPSFLQRGRRSPQLRHR